MKHRGVGRVVLACLIAASCVLCLPRQVSAVPHSLVPSEEIAAMLRAKGVMIGYEDGSMRWEGTVTRAEAVKILLTAMGEEAPSLDRSPMVFIDVSPSHWAFGHITLAAEMGIVRGRPGKIFDPEEKITMAEFMVMASRVYGGLGSRPGSTDPGVRIEPAWAAMEIVGWQDLIDVVTEKSPTANVDYPASRGEVAVLTGMVMERLGLAYDLTGVAERFSNDGSTLFLKVDDGADALKVPVAKTAAWFADGRSVNSQVLLGRAVRVTLDTLGKAAVVVSGP